MFTLVRKRKKQEIIFCMDIKQLQYKLTDSNQHLK